VSVLEVGLSEAEGSDGYLDVYRKSSIQRERDWERFVREKWVNLVALETDRMRGDKLDNCGEGYVKKMCTNHSNHPTTEHPLFCKDDLCMKCGDKRTQDRVTSAWSRIKMIRARWWHLVFTIPTEFRRRIRKGDERFKGLMKAVRRAVCDVFGGKAGGFMTRHTFSSDRPWEENVHIHCLVSSKVPTVKGGVREFRWFEDSAIRDLKVKFVEYVEEEVGVSMYGCKTEDGLPNVYVQYANREKVRVHLLRYLLRNPLVFKRLGFDGDDFWWDGAGKGKIHVVAPKVLSGAFRHYRKGWHKAVWFGWLGYNCAKKYSFLSVRNGSRGGVRESCEVCGSPMMVYEIVGDGFSFCIEDT
jgi:hypothetical protein